MVQSASWRRTAGAIALAAVPILGCVGDIGPRGRKAPAPDTLSPGATGTTTPVEACKKYDCSNVIDAVVIPKLVANGLEPTLEENSVLCRRLAIDLTGLVPTPDEIATECTGHDAKQMSDYFMNKPSNAAAVDGSPPYVFVNRRFWANPQRFTYDTIPNAFADFYFYVRELDQLVGDVYAGTIPYDEFAIRALGHPAFIKHYGDFRADKFAPNLIALARQAVRVFLGYDPVDAEAANLANLWRGWSSFTMYEDETFALYPDCPYGIFPPDSGEWCTHTEMGLDGRRCQGVKALACRSSVFGPAEVIPKTPEFTRYYDLSPEDKEILRIPGRLFVARPEFAEAAVDMALQKYLGWWKIGAFKPNFDLDEVRSTLANKFVGDAYDLRKLEREIVTSVLYVQAAQRAPSAKVPLWAFGPTKIIPGVAWVDMLGQAIGIDFGVFDFRFGEADYLSGHFDEYGTFKPNYRIPLQDALGNDGGLMALNTRRALLEDNCSADGVPPDSTPQQLIEKAFAGIGRPATADEKAILLEEIAAADGDGCPDLASCDRSQLAIALCRSIYATATFTFY